MTQGERINNVRKSLNLTLEKFGENLGVTKTAISRIEKGERSCTEQMAKSICREYSVDYDWLITGDGEMFIETDDNISELIDRIMFGENEFHKNLFKVFARLDVNELLALEQIIDKFTEVKNKKKD